MDCSPEAANGDRDHDPEHEALHMAYPMREVLNPVVFPVDGKCHKVCDESGANLGSSLHPDACIALQVSRSICDHDRTNYQSHSQLHTTSA